MRVLKTAFGQLNGKEIEKYTLENDRGMRVSFINYGCIITEIFVPDANGVFENVVLGFDNLDAYVENSAYFGAIIGRVAGRIREGTFQMNGSVYRLSQNEGKNHLHGAGELNHAIWHAQILNPDSENTVSVKFSYHSSDGANGYPGNVDVSVTYSLDNENTFKIAYEAESDKDTVLNLTNHSYFNLSGNCKADVCSHILKADISKFVELRNDLIPTGRLCDVEGTVFDFSLGRKLADGVESTNSQNILAGNGYDHALVFSNCKGANLAILSEPVSGRKMTMKTDYPCFVLYSGNQLKEKYMGVCLETQLLPDAVNHQNFEEYGSVILEKNRKYSHCTSYIFGI